MSNEVTTTMARLATNIIGVIITVLGLLLVYYSINTEYNLVNPFIFTPIGVVISLIGGLMILARES